MNTENDTCHIYSVVHPSQTCGFRGKQHRRSHETHSGYIKYPFLQEA